jgi:hypothetical protein
VKIVTWAAAGAVIFGCGGDVSAGYSSGNLVSQGDGSPGTGGAPFSGAGGSLATGGISGAGARSSTGGREPSGTVADSGVDATGSGWRCDALHPCLMFWNPCTSSTCVNGECVFVNACNPGSGGSSTGSGGTTDTDGCTESTSGYPLCNIQEGDTCNNPGGTVTCCSGFCSVPCGHGGAQPYISAFECVLSGSSAILKLCGTSDGPIPVCGASPPARDH